MGKKVGDKISPDKAPAPKPSDDKPTESYDSGTFEQSNTLSKDESTSRKGLNYWPGTAAVDAGGDSAQESQEKQIFSANAMEDYLKK